MERLPKTHEKQPEADQSQNGGKNTENTPKKGKSQEASQEQVAIQEDKTSVSYFGVRLEKARDENGQFVPKKETYEDYIDDSFSLELQRKIAISFAQGDPILIEGGTSIGKTTTVKKMAADLGWEVHYANLNGATDIEDLMGRYIPNSHKTKPEDPEYIFADGKVTSGLRKEEGKTKIIILDEFNAAAPNILIRLHEVLDALERDGDVVLSEDASEIVATDKANTKIVALMNPPGKGYFGREPLDPAQLRRWVYQKEVTELPQDTFSDATDALFGVESESEIRSFSSPHYKETHLPTEQLSEIPGIENILKKYKEFHNAAKGMLKQRQLAEDQPQQFSFDDRMEPRRVRDFVLRFYSGDIDETFQEALRYYYAGKLESDGDREKLGELIRQVDHISETEPRRKGTESGEGEDGSEGGKKEAGFEEFEQKSLDYIQKLMDEGANKDYVAEGLAGLDSDRAWEMRERLLKEGADKGWVAVGLAGRSVTFVWQLDTKKP